MEMEILFLRKAIFFPALQNDRRKFLQGLGKKDFMKKDCNEQLEIASKKDYDKTD
ncbi:hypothetical protein [Flavobacterium nackdongense]|uniref:hypothetical protein n=1 Tax=Flavobacterium nackdongense TaxID=2547394 RepID=UPI0013FD00B5|nr:hypothetical protein [Flavobacterium nackdongense]